MKALALRRGSLGVRNGLAERGRHAIPASNDAQAHTLGYTVGRFGNEVLVKQS
jgi:hypothetical protein